MEIEPIGNVGGVAVPFIPSEPGHIIDRSPAHVALVEAQAREAQSVAQRAGDGDPAALAQLAEEQKLLVPIDSQQLLPPPLESPPGPQEPGKGNIIDIYD